MMQDKQNLTILFVEPSGAGGIAHYTYALANALAKKDVPSHILTARRWNLPEIDGPVTVHKIFRGVQTPFIRLLKTCMMIRRDITHVHWQSTTHARLVLTLMRAFPVRIPPWVFTVHNVLPHEQKNSSKVVYQKIYKKMQGLIFHTNFSKEQFLKEFSYIHAQTDVIPLGEYGFLSQKKHVETKENAFKTLLFFGNIRPYKGLDLLLEAMPEVKKQVPDVRLIIAGQALEPFERYQKQIDELGLHDCVDIRLEYHPDEELARIFAEANIVPLPYRSVDQSAVLLLAMAMGKTVIATDVGGLAEVIEHNKNGLLVKPDNSSELAQAIVEMLRDPKKAHELAQAAGQDAQTHFSWDLIADKTIQFYQRLLNHA